MSQTLGVHKQPTHSQTCDEMKPRRCCQCLCACVRAVASKGRQAGQGGVYIIIVVVGVVVLRASASECRVRGGRARRQHANCPPNRMLAGRWCAYLLCSPRSSASCVAPTRHRSSWSSGAAPACRMNSDGARPAPAARSRMRRNSGPLCGVGCSARQLAHRPACSGNRRWICTQRRRVQRRAGLCGPVRDCMLPGR